MNNIKIVSGADELARYVGKVEDATRERNIRIAKSLDNIFSRTWFNDFKDTGGSILTTGSDWRLENKPFFDDVTSFLDIVLVAPNTTLNVSRVSDLLQLMQETASFVINDVEIKWPEDSLSLYKNERNRVYPTRIFDAFSLLGDEKLLNELKNAVIQEIADNNGIARRFADYLRVHKNVLKNHAFKIHWEETREFDLNEWIIYFDPQNHTFSVKTWPLRVVQYSLALALFRKIRDSWHQDIGFINTLPANICERLDFLLDNDLTNMSQGEVEELKFIYSYFLKIYHDLQYSYFGSWDTAYNVDKDSLQDIKKMMSFLSDTLSVDRIFK